MNKTIISIILTIAVIVIGWMLISNNKTSTSKTGLNEIQQKVFENILAGGKLKVVTTQEGSGPESKIGDRVGMNYVGKLENGTVFDSNTDSNAPYMFTLGEGRVIQGWDIGVLGMKKGEKRTLTIASELAYGSAQYGVIPPNSTLIFDVELVSIGQ